MLEAELSIDGQVRWCFILYLVHAISLAYLTRRLSSPVPLPDLYFYLFSYPIAPIVSSTGGIISLIYLLFAEPIAKSV